VSFLIFTINFFCTDKIRDFLNSINCDEECCIVILDNSVDIYEWEKLKRLMLEFPCLDIKIENMKSNLGYSGGNQFLYEKYRNYDYEKLIIANPDVKFSSNFFHTLQLKQIKKLETLSFRTRDDSGKVLYDRVGLKGFLTKYYIEKDAGIFMTDYLPGSCFVLDKSINLDYLFDPSFFMYWEEIDLAIRLKSLDYKLYATNLASIMRVKNSQQSINNAFFWSAKNSFRLTNKIKKGHIYYLIRLIALGVYFSCRQLSFSPIIKIVSGILSGIKL